MVKIIISKEQTKLQWLQGSNEINMDNLKNVQCEAIKHFRNKKRKYMKDKINELDNEQ
jgi:hypothetical protein